MSIKIIAWTGGSAPPSTLPSDVAELAENLHSEQVTTFQNYWGDLPDETTDQTFRTRANYDAWSTLRHKYE